ncbi:MAG TPA: DUF397 domain-containing protein [Streptosporangiaceae bacterium]|nr:DUF397 domain-containing protein [Streptosporangiaceae bacterium]
MVTGEWCKASKSNSFSNCVEVRAAGGRVQVRDSKDPDGPVLTVSPAAWHRFLLDQVKRDKQ